MRIELTKRFLLPALFITAFVAFPLLATQTFEAKVIGVMDGDTLEVFHEGEPLRIRLYGIDSPEKSQPFATQAKKQLSSLIFGKTVTIEARNIDRYGRTVAIVKLSDGREHQS